MYCLKCKEYREGFYCPECGSRLVENPIGTTGGLHLGDANAISGGIHYSETNNVSNNITNNTTNVYEAQKTELEIIQENETGFFDAVLLAVSNGTFGPKERAELERERIRRHVSPQRAEEIIASARKTSIIADKGADKGFLENHVIADVKEALELNDIDALRSKVPVLRGVASDSFDEDIQFHYQMLQASFYPESSVVDLLGARLDIYWQVFWGYVAYLKLGNDAGAASLLPKIAKFGHLQGNISLLMAIGCLFECRQKSSPESKDRVYRYLEQAVENGINEGLIPVWRTVKGITDDEREFDKSLGFYRTVSFRELIPSEKPTVNPVGVDPQKIDLPQMRGFNPLVAASQLGLGQIVKDINKG